MHHESASCGSPHGPSLPLLRVFHCHAFLHVLLEQALASSYIAIVWRCPRMWDMKRKADIVWTGRHAGEITLRDAERRFSAANLPETSSMCALSFSSSRSFPDLVCASWSASSDILTLVWVAWPAFKSDIACRSPQGVIA